MMRTSIIVQNLKCGGCAKTITHKLLEHKGISRVDIAVEESKVTFDCHSSEAELEARSILKSMGYPSIEERNSIMDKTKSFISCATGKMGSR